MLIEYKYEIAWGLYLLCALGFFGLMWPVFHRIPWRGVRRFFKALLAVLLFTPAASVPAENFLAPATLVFAYEALTGDMELAIQAGMLLGLAFVALLGVLLLETLFRRLLQSPSQDE